MELLAHFVPGPVRSVPEILLGAALSIAWIGSLWATLRRECASCSKVALLVGGLPLGALGLGGYGLLLILWIFSPSDGMLRLCLPLAAGTHFFLLRLLAGGRIVCAPCLLTGAGALLAASLSLAWGAKQALVLAVLTPLAYVATAQGTRWAAQRYRLQSLLQTKRLAGEVIAEEATPAAAEGGRVILFVRKDCSTCHEFEAQVLGPALHNLGGQLRIDRRWITENGILTPAVIVLGGTSSLLLPSIYRNTAETRHRLDEAIRNAEWQQPAGTP